MLQLRGAQGTHSVVPQKKGNASSLSLAAQVPKKHSNGVRRVHCLRAEWHDQRVHDWLAKPKVAVAEHLVLYAAGMNCVLPCKVSRRGRGKVREEERPARRAGGTLLIQGG